MEGTIQKEAVCGGGSNCLAAYVCDLMSQTRAAEVPTDDAT